jgi:hypothetical protein
VRTAVEGDIVHWRRACTSTSIKYLLRPESEGLPPCVLAAHADIGFRRSTGVARRGSRRSTGAVFVFAVVWEVILTYAAAALRGGATHRAGLYFKDFLQKYLPTKAPLTPLRVLIMSNDCGQPVLGARP